MRKTFFCKVKRVDTLLSQNDTQYQEVKAPSSLAKLDARTSEGFNNPLMVFGRVIQGWKRQRDPAYQVGLKIC